MLYHPKLYAIRPADHRDAEALRHLAELRSQRPLSGPALVGEIDGEVAAAVSLTDHGAVADPRRATDSLLAHLRVRARGVRAAEAMPSLRERMRAAVSPGPAA
ncbi:MAG TPA: hypothetical protein VLB47_01980 [Solirubrobacteraceae bacterium]|nr:hypothetical protein [Solirubrobacteraceae bacterium]